MNEPPIPPPQQYGQYYRPPAAYVFQGDPDKLQALADGYFGLNIAFIINIVLNFAIGFGVPAALTASSLYERRGGWGPAGWLIYFAGWAILGVSVAFLTYPHNKRIAFGMGWSSSPPLIASILMAINSVVCCGIIGYSIMQQLAAGQIKLYGVKRAFMGYRKKDVEAAVEDLRSRMAQTQGAVPPPAG